MKKALEELAGIIKNSKDTVVMTGAGMDTESNIPDFRSEQGWWNKIDPMTIANINAFYENYHLFHEFYSARIKGLDNLSPHQGHYVLAELEKLGYIKSIATQNVTGLHAAAGSKNIYELHGNIREIRCNECYQEHSINEFLKNGNCNYCGKKTLRPDVVLFGEALPTYIWQNAIKAVEDSEVLIIIGTSLQVYPVNQFPYMTKGKVIYINMEKADGYDFDLEIIGKAGEVLGKLSRILL